MSRLLLVLTTVVLASVGALASHGCSAARVTSTDAGADDDAMTAAMTAARAHIQHVVIIAQENRSFDHYFGTFPGADGIPQDGGIFTVCLPGGDGGCSAPFHETADLNNGGPHSAAAAVMCINDGGMNGFALSFDSERDVHCKRPGDPNCSPTELFDVMGYHDDREIPNYWTYARSFTLLDHMFEPVVSYSLPEHLYMVSAWAAACTPPDDPTHCVSDVENPGNGMHLGTQNLEGGRPPSTRGPT